MAKNTYLQKQQAVYKGFLDAGLDTGFQKCWDLMQLVLHDPTVMGKDTFGKGRIKKLYIAMQKKELEMRNAWMMEVDSDVYQRDLDALLGEIWGEELCPFVERYPYITQPDYTKGKKKWRE